MKSKRILLIVLLLVVVGIVKFYDVIPSQQETPDSTLDKNTDSNDPDTASDSLPIIDFPLLAEARPKDLIDMSLAFPEELQKLDGKKVRLIGFMAPFDSLEDMSKCMMVPSYVGCTFCTPPNLRQVVFVTQGAESSEETYPFIEEPSYVTGIFRITNSESTHEGKNQGFVYSIENAEVTAHTGEAPKRAPGHATPGSHNKGQNAEPLPKVSTEELIQEVIDMLGQNPPRPIRLEKVSQKIFEKNIAEQIERHYPQSLRSARAKAFSILGLLPEKIDWIDILTGFELSTGVAHPEPSGQRVLVLDSVPFDHPFVRLNVVGAISDAIFFQKTQKEKDTDSSNPFINEDMRRAGESLRHGIRKTIIRRYATAKSISPKIPPPTGFIPGGKQFAGTTLLNRWYTLPGFVGPFFIDFLVGPTGPLSDLEPAFQRPPSTMMEFLRPMWYQDMSSWDRKPVPENFADRFMDIPPTLTDVLGIGGLIPWLAQPNSSYMARSIAGQWAGDRWALWEFDDGSAAMLMETRWQDERSALEFSQSIPEHLFQWLFPHEEGSSTVRILRGSTLAALNRVDPFPK